MMSKEEAEKKNSKNTNSDEHKQKDSKNESKKKSMKEVKELEMRAKELEKENKELVTLVKTIQADFQNYKKRVEKLKEDDKLRANEAIITDLLDVLDAVELGIKHAESSKGDVDGLKLIYNKLMALLENYGCKKITSLEKFDPSLHLAIASQHTDDKKEDGKIVEVFQSGFKLGNKVIRHAKVKILKSD